MVAENARPHFPAGAAPEAYVRLAKDCWAQASRRRPAFPQVVARLEALAAELGFAGSEALQVLVGEL